MRKRTNHQRGLLAETMALVWLMLKGYWPIATRYKTPVGEIDLVMKRGKQLVFVEVKARKQYSDAAEAVHSKNQARVVRAAHYYLQSHPQYAYCNLRFDVCAIAWYRLPKHLSNAFQ